MATGLFRPLPGYRDRFGRLNHRPDNHSRVPVQGVDPEKEEGKMNRLSKDELKTLRGGHQGFCISIFLPASRTGVENQRYRIRPRNLLGFTLPPGKMRDAAAPAAAFRY